jgi:hypothetical protein
MTAQQMKKWEYWSLDLAALPRRHSETDVLNEMGREGWELVAVTPPHRGIFKRLVPDAEQVAPPKSSTRRNRNPATNES